MDKANQSSVTEFIVLGFPNVTGYKALVLFITLVIVYILTLMINTMVIVVVTIKSQLHSPMYFFLQQLSIVEYIFLLVIVPNMLRVIWLEGATMSIAGCITQAYVYASIGCTEFHLLTVMAYDRYLAICNPLRYTTIMNTKLQRVLVVYCWVFGFFVSQITLNLLLQPEYCGSNVIDHFFCDLVPFIKLACSFKVGLQLGILILSVPIIVIPFILIIISYICVFVTILGISSTTGRKKAFSTCSSHITVVSVVFVTAISIYSVPVNENTLTINKLISMLYVVVSPLFNPFIYCLRNQEMRDVLEKIFRIKNIKNDEK
ncbi:olfactory receptor 6P1-like [Dendropsophus ebraccatus]|uniref:olfactory receptor 6P1-like n=1 Tax=Dendropsophus ebraccatus TaxID=150705 RepID=UPI0038312565